MNNKELEELFDEKFEETFGQDGSINQRQAINDFILNEVIPEVVNSLMPSACYCSNGCDMCRIKDYIKEKAKTLSYL